MTPAFAPTTGGVQRTTYKLGKYFVEHGHEVIYFSLSSEGHVPVDYGKLFHAEENGKSRNHKNIAKLSHVLETERPDVVINQMPYEAPMREALYKGKEEQGYLLLGCLRNALFSVKNNLSAYAASIPLGLGNLLQNPLGHRLLLAYHKQKHARDLRAILDKHDYFVMLTPPNAEELSYFVGDYKAEKVTAIPNSIPDVYRQEMAKEKIILHVGRLNTKQKRSELLLPFWKKAHPALPDWTFIVVGDGPYLEAMSVQIEREQIPRVQLMGRQQPNEYYQKAPIFVMPSAYEGFPNVLIEAQSFGSVPVVYDNYPALSWIVNKNTDAILVDAFAVEQMASSVVDLAQSPDKRAAMIKASMENAGRFTIQKVGRQWEAFFDQNLGNE